MIRSISLRTRAIPILLAIASIFIFCVPETIAQTPDKSIENATPHRASDVDQENTDNEFKNHRDHHDDALKSASQAATIVANSSQVVSNTIQLFVLIFTVAGGLLALSGFFVIPRWVKKNVDAAIVEITRKLKNDISTIASEAVVDVSDKVAKEHSLILSIYTEIAGALDRETSNALANAITNNQDILKSLLIANKIGLSETERDDKIAQFSDFQYERIQINDGMVEDLLGIISPNETRNKMSLEKVLALLDKVPVVIQENIVSLLEAVEKSDYFGPNDANSLVKIKATTKKFKKSNRSQLP